MDALTFEELEDMDRLARQACPQQLRLWARRIREARHQLAGDHGDYADALLLKVDHCASSQKLEAVSEPPCDHAMVQFEYLTQSL